jgi:hypothetical protein
MFLKISGIYFVSTTDPDNLQIRNNSVLALPPPRISKPDRDFSVTTISLYLSLSLFKLYLSDTKSIMIRPSFVIRLDNLTIPNCVSHVSTLTVFGFASLSVINPVVSKAFADR